MYWSADGSSAPQNTTNNESDNMTDVKKSEQSHPKYISPVTDFGFKRIFKDEEITRGFLNDLLATQEPHTHIAKVTITDGERDETRSDIRRVVFDVHCTSDTGEEFVIEMQNDSQEFFSDRIALYLSRAVSRQQTKGFIDIEDDGEENQSKPWDYHLKNIYGVFFMNFKDKKHPQPLSHFALMETKEHYRDTDVFQYWKIQMPFYRRMRESDCKTNIDKWIFNLSNMQTMENQLSFRQDIPLFARLEKIAEYSALSPKQQMEYDDSYHNYVCYRGQMDSKYNEGVAKGRAEGRAEGIQIGEERAQAIAHNANLQSARVLYQTGCLPIEQIANAMNLDVAELTDYINQHK